MRKSEWGFFLGSSVVAAGLSSFIGFKSAVMPTPQPQEYIEQLEQVGNIAYDNYMKPLYKDYNREDYLKHDRSDLTEAVAVKEKAQAEFTQNYLHKRKIGFTQWGGLIGLILGAAGSILIIRQGNEIYGPSTTQYPGDGTRGDYKQGS